MQFEKKQVTTHLVAFCLGAIIAYAINDYVHLSKVARTGDGLNNARKMQPKQRTFDNPADQFDRMFKSMNHAMDQAMRNQGQQIQDAFSGGVSVEESEDNDFYRVTIKGEGIDKESLGLDINSGVLRITGQINKETKSNLGVTRYSSSFSRSFSIPTNVNQGNPEVESQGDEIIISFKKL